MRLSGGEVVAVLKVLRRGQRWTIFLGPASARQLLRYAPKWDLTGITLHDDEDLSEYPPPPGFWRALRWRLQCWISRM